MTVKTFKNVARLLHLLMVLNIKEGDRAAAIVLFIAKILNQAASGGAADSPNIIRANMALIIKASSRRWSTQTVKRREVISSRNCYYAF